MFSRVNGINLGYSNNCSINNNTVTTSLNDGINLYFSHKTVIENNTVTSSGKDGIHISKSNNNSIITNNLLNNWGFGLLVGPNSNDSFFQGNNFGNNTLGSIFNKTTFINQVLSTSSTEEIFSSFIIRISLFFSIITILVWLTRQKFLQERTKD
jgi:parallel beta-helix repeat protein